MIFRQSCTKTDRSAMFPVQKKCIVNKACNIVQKIILSALITIVATLYFFYGKQVSNPFVSVDQLSWG